MAAIALYVERSAVESWLRDRALALYLKKIEPGLPFKIESFEIRKGSWKDFLNWKIPELALVLRRDDWRARLVGSIEIKRSKAQSVSPGGVASTETSATFKPQITLERISSPLTLGPFDTYISTRIFVNGAVRTLDDLADIREAKVRVQSAGKVAWAPLGVEVVEPFLRLDWVAPGGATTGGSSKYKQAKEGTLLVQAHAKSLNWTQPGQPGQPAMTNRMASLVEPSLEAETPLEMKPGESPPLAVGPEATFDIHVKSGEALWDEAYLNIPWALLPFHGKVQLLGFRPERAEVSIGPEKTGINLTAMLLGAPYKATWKSRGNWELKDWVKGLLDATSGSTGPLASLNQLRKIGFRKGRIQTQGRATLAKVKAPGDTLAVSGVANLALSGLDLDFPEASAAVRGLSLDLEAGTSSGLKGLLEIPEIYFRHAKAKLGRVPFSAIPQNGHAFHLKIGEGENLPLEVPGIPFHLGTFSGALDLKPAKGAEEEGPQYYLKTHLEVPPLGLERLSTPFCLPKRLPPALLSVRFPKLELYNGTIDPEGTVRVNLFEGQITVDDIGLFDLFSEVPETDFNLDFKGIRLDQAGNWSALGEIDGFLEGYAHDVMIVSWLPTHFDLRMEAKPHDSAKIAFSPDALENFVRVVAGEDALESLPGIAKWFMFGWPARLNSGYDVDYAGISAFSQDGNILIETLDPPDPDKKNSGNHFILKGARFKMPLKSSHYPLIVDNTAMGGFVHQRVTYLLNLAEEKRLEREESKKKKGQKDGQEIGTTDAPHDESEVDCLPDVLRTPAH
jgi:hypothetical protein